MGVLIEGMEMPFTCLTCDFHKCAGGVGDFCSLTKRRQFRFKNRPKDCPLIEVPEPHGRLGDLDAPISLIDTRGEKVEVTVAHIIEKNQGIVKAIIPESEKT